MPAKLCHKINHFLKKNFHVFVSVVLGKMINCPSIEFISQAHELTVNILVMPAVPLLMTHILNVPLLNIKFYQLIWKEGIGALWISRSLEDW